MDRGRLRDEVERAFQDLGPGMALMNLLVLRDLVDAGSRGDHETARRLWEATRNGTVLKELELAEPAFEDLRAYWERLLDLAAVASVPLRHGLLSPVRDAHGNNLFDHDVILVLLSGIDETRTVLSELGDRPGHARDLPRVRARVETAWDWLYTSQRRRQALETLERRVETLLSAAPGIG